MSLRDRAREAPTTVVNISALLGLVVNGTTCSVPVNVDRMPERGAGEQPVLSAARRTYRNAEFRLHVSGRMSELATRGRAGVHPWCPDDLGGLPPVLRHL